MCFEAQLICYFLILKPLQLQRSRKLTFSWSTPWLLNVPFLLSSTFQELLVYTFPAFPDVLYQLIS